MGKGRTHAGGTGKPGSVRQHQIDAQVNERSTVVMDAPSPCDHPYCTVVVAPGDPVYKSRNRDAYYCSKICRDRHVRILAQFRRRNDPETRLRDRALRLERKYGISIEDFDLLYTFQAGGCAICDTVLEGVQICVDHDHATGEVRGLLCGPCNAGVGMFMDNPENMRRAARYITRPTAPQALSAHAGEEVT